MAVWQDQPAILLAPLSLLMVNLQGISWDGSLADN